MYKLTITLVSLILTSLFTTAQVGSLDSDFDGDGFLSIDGGTLFDNGTHMLVQSDGKVLVFGYNGDGLNAGDIVVFRFNPDGSADNSFGTGGKATIDINNQKDYALVARQLQNGKIIIGGTTGADAGTQDFLVVRLTPDGVLDNTFNSVGYVVIDQSADFDRIYDIAIAPDGSIFCAGEMDDGGSLPDFAVVKLTAAGAIDNTFSFDGIVTTDFGGSEDVIYEIVIQSDGKIVAAGVTENVTTSDFAMARYNTDGTLDNTFGTGGKLTISFVVGAEFAFSLDLLPGDKLLVGGSVRDGVTNYEMAIARLNADGSFDNSFNGDGKLVLTASADDDILAKVLLLPNGGFLLAGYTSDVSNTNLIAMRLLADGSADNTFGTAGVSIPVVANNSITTEYAALGPDGELYMVGTIFENGENNLFVARIITKVNVGILDRGDDVINPAIFPNPVQNGQLTIEYELTEAQPLTITLIDMQGREISTLLSETRNAGTHRETLSFPSVLAKGYYLLQLQTEGGTTAVKVLVD